MRRLQVRTRKKAGRKTLHESPVISNIYLDKDKTDETGILGNL
jgi:hypothetical protein